MRGADVTREGLFEARTTAECVPAEHPLIAIREILNRALGEMDMLLESMYEARGRYSVAFSLAHDTCARTTHEGRFGCHSD